MYVRIGDIYALPFGEYGPELREWQYGDWAQREIAHYDGPSTRVNSRTK